MLPVLLHMKTDLRQQVQIPIDRSLSASQHAGQVADASGRFILQQADELKNTQNLMLVVHTSPV